VGNILEHLNALGEMPLPPYIKRESSIRRMEDFERYQTIYAKAHGSVAAPTAGLHFTDSLLNRVRAAGVEVQCVTLHIGSGTFVQVKSDDIAGHVMHEERFEIGEEAARAIRRAKAEGRRVVAVGTTSLRVLESVAAEDGECIRAGSGRTRIFIHPPFRFQIVDALVTNFHLPRSTPLMLVCAFAAPGEMQGRERILCTYAEAVREGYRFFSYGDAMFIS
jgi:S-adenosylmethionine:tRNA ribosyltransferase-isomerase